MCVWGGGGVFCVGVLGAVCVVEVFVFNLLYNSIAYSSNLITVIKRPIPC